MSEVVALWLLTLAWLAPGPLERWSVSADIAINADGVFLADQVVGEDQGHGLVARPIAAIGEHVDLVALDTSDPALTLLCLDVPVALPAGQSSRPADVLGWDGSTLTRVFDSAAAGIAAATGCDAVARSGNDLLISFDRSLGSPVLIRPADLALWNGSTLSLGFDSAAAGVAPMANLDAASVGPDGSLWLSFDHGGKVSGITYADDDVLSYQAGSGNWDLVRRLANDSDRWFAADLDALSVRSLPDELFSNGFE